MKTIITSDISRLSLHDSSFDGIVRQDQNFHLTFDWAKLENFKEENFDEAIIMGKTKMLLTGINSEQFKIYDENDNSKFVLSPLPDDYLTATEVIAANSINDDAKTVLIGRLYKEHGTYHWTEWSFKYDTCKISWTSFVTYTEWQSGKLPAD